MIQTKTNFWNITKIHKGTMLSHPNLIEGLEIWSSIDEIINFWEKVAQYKRHSCKSYQSVLAAVKDELTPAK